MKKTADQVTTQYTVELLCTVYKVLICEGGTLEQIRANPYEYAVDERENGQVDWQVRSIREDRP